MGSGKSTVGEALARCLGWGFRDLDRWIEDRRGLTVAEIFRRHGEPSFRDEERRAPPAAAPPRPPAGAAGGGALSAGGPPAPVAAGARPRCGPRSRRGLS